MTHHCMLDGCDKRVDVRHAICGDHYRLLPRDHVEAIQRAYYPAVGEGIVDLPRGLTLVLNNAAAWIRSVMTADNRREFTPEDWERVKVAVRARDAARAERRGASG